MHFYTNAKFICVLFEKVVQGTPELLELDDQSGWQAGRGFSLLYLFQLWNIFVQIARRICIKMQNLFVFFFEKVVQATFELLELDDQSGRQAGRGFS